MVSRVEVVSQRERAIPVAIERLVAWWGYNPVIPAHITEIHVQSMAATILLALARPLVCMLRAALGPPREQRLAPAIVAEGDQERPEASPFGILQTVSLR